MPLPEPLPPLLIDSHVALLVAVHAQLLVVVTEAVAVPPLAARLCVVGDTVKLQAPAWVIVTAWPAIVSVPVRELVDVFAAALKATVPGPVPVPPLEIVSQVAPLVAVQPQPAAVVTVEEPGPPAAVTACVVGDTEYVHGAANEKVFEGALRPVPPGPTAATLAS